MWELRLPETLGTAPEPTDWRALAGRNDPSDMYAAVIAQIGQLDEAMQGAATWVPRLRTPSAVLAVGTGGSAAGIELLADVLRDRLRVPLVTQRGPTIPGWVSEKSLVVVSSWSGDTAEAISAAETASSRGAQLVAITTGGALLELASRSGGDALLIPRGLRPRAALGYLSALGAMVLVRAGLLDELELRRSLDQTRTEGDAVLASIAFDSPDDGNPAKQLARAMLSRVPIVIGTRSLRSPSVRWREQLNENAKVWAFDDLLPDAIHNTVLAFGSAPLRERCLLVSLEWADDPTPGALLRWAKEPAVRVRVNGGPSLSSLFGLALLGDVTSLYLAYLRGVDPTPGEVVAAIKEELRGSISKA